MNKITAGAKTKVFGETLQLEVISRLETSRLARDRLLKLGSLLHQAQEYRRQGWNINAAFFWMMKYLSSSSLAKDEADAQTPWWWRSRLSAFVIPPFCPYGDTDGTADLNRDLGRKDERNGDSRPHPLTLIDSVFVYCGMRDPWIQSYLCATW